MGASVLEARPAPEGLAIGRDVLAWLTSSWRRLRAVLDAAQPASKEEAQFGMLAEFAFSRFGEPLLSADNLEDSRVAIPLIGGFHSRAAPQPSATDPSIPLIGAECTPPFLKVVPRASRIKGLGKRMDCLRIRPRGEPIALVDV